MEIYKTFGQTRKPQGGSNMEDTQAATQDQGTDTGKQTNQRRVKEKQTEIYKELISW